MSVWVQVGKSIIETTSLCTNCELQDICTGRLMPSLRRLKWACGFFQNSWVFFNRESKNAIQHSSGSLCYVALCIYGIIRDGIVDTTLISPYPCGAPVINKATNEIWNQIKTSSWGAFVHMHQEWMSWTKMHIMTIHRISTIQCSTRMKCPHKPTRITQVIKARESTLWDAKVPHYHK